MDSSPKSAKTQQASQPGKNGETDPAQDTAAASRSNTNRTGPEQTAKGVENKANSRFGGDVNTSLEAVIFLERLAEASASAGNRTENLRFAALAQAARRNHEKVFPASRAQKASPKDDADELPDIEPFPVDALAPIQREMVLRTAESIGVHPNLPAIAALGIVAAAIGRGLRAKSGPNQTIGGNLFLIGSAIPQGRDCRRHKQLAFAGSYRRQ